MDTWIDIAELKRRHQLDAVIEVSDHSLTPLRGGIRRGWHCDCHRNEQELTVFLNRGDDGYFVCNRCGLRGDMIAWVGNQLFGDGYNPRNYQQLQEIAKYLGDQISPVGGRGDVQEQQKGEEKPTTVATATPDEAWVATAHRRLLTNPRCDAHRRYLANRGIHINDAKRWRIGAFKLEVVLPVYEAGQLLAIVKRRIERKRYHILGTADVLFNADALQDSDWVLICEAPLDTIIAARELPGWAVVAPIAGCWSWPERYNPLLREKKRLVIGYDNDATGNEAAVFFFRLFSRTERLLLPEGLDIGDAWLTAPDFFRDLKR